MSTLFPSQERAVSPKIFLLLALAVTAFSSAALSQTDTWKGGNGNWSNGSMWSSGVPGSGSNVHIDNSNPLASIVTLDESDTINTLTVDSDDALTCNLNTSLTVNGGSISNAGQITVNGGDNTNSALTLGSSTALSGGGRLTLATGTTGGGGNAILQGNSTTLTTNNIIQGEGVIGNGSLSIVNQSGGTIDANSTATGGLIRTLTLNGSGGITNQGLMEATNSGVLQIQTGVNNSSGNITANGSSAVVQLLGAGIQGGTLNTKNGGTFITPNGNASTLDGSTHGALTLSTGSTYTSDFNSTTNIVGTITNNGNFQINGGDNTNTALNLVGGTAFQGTGGMLTLFTGTSGGGGNAILDGNGQTLTNTNNVIQGEGIIGNGSLAVINQGGGTIDANSKGGAGIITSLTLNGSGGITNAGLLEATNSGLLQIQNTVNNASGTGGNITANGGTVAFEGADILGGTLNSENAGILITPGGNSATLDGKSDGALTLSTGSTYTSDFNSTTNILGAINNKGNFQINGGNNTNTALNLAASTSLQGGGTLTLFTGSSGGGGNAIIMGNGTGTTLTNVNDTIRGTGVIGNGSLTLVNQATIDANATGGGQPVGLLLNGGGGITNTGTLEATNSGVLQIQTSVNNAGGSITANGSSAVVELTGASIQGGTLNTLSGGTLITPSGNSSTLNGSTSSGAITLSTASTYTSGFNTTTNIVGTFSNNGNFQINGGDNTNTTLNLVGNTTLQGSRGTVTLSTGTTGGGGNAILQGNGQKLTNTNNVIQGEGIIGNGSLAFVNQTGGTVNANFNGGSFVSTLTLNGSGGVTNTGLLEATNSGVLQIQNTVNNAGGNITANGTSAVVQLLGASVQGGTLNTKNGGKFITPNGNSATLDGATKGMLNISKGSAYTSDFNTTTNVVGTINNSGNMQINGGDNTNTALNLVGNTTLKGSGTVTLFTGTTGGGGNAILQGNSFTLTNSSDTIQGAGIIGNGSLSLINGGTIFASSSGQTLLLNGSGKITNNGTFSVASGAALHVQNGPFANFAGSTLTGGTYNTAGTLQIDELGSGGGEIVTNAANIILNGPSSTFIDAAGKNALSALNTNAASSSFTINNRRNFTTAGNFTNNGTLTIGSSNSKFDVNGNLTNFSGTTLTGGSYNITGTLQFNGANIVTNAANLTLSGTSSAILNQTAGNGLANFAANTSGGSFTLASGRNFTTAGDFSNAGTLNIGAGTNFTVGGPGLFTQTAGVTKDDGTQTDSGGFDLNGGSLIGKGTISGAIDNASGTVTPGDSSASAGILTDKGAYTQGASGKLDIAIGGTTAGSQYDELNATTVNLNGGTLKVSLINGFVPKIGQKFKIMNFNSETGTGFSSCSCAINSTEHFVVAVQGTDVMLTVVSGAAASVTPVRMLRSGSQLADLSLRLFGNSAPLRWNLLATRENREGGYLTRPKPAGFDPVLVDRQSQGHVLTLPMRGAAIVSSNVHVYSFAKELPQFPTTMPLVDSRSSSKLRIQPEANEVYAFSPMASRPGVDANPMVTLMGSGFRRSTIPSSVKPLSGLEIVSSHDGFRMFSNTMGVGANILRKFDNTSVPRAFTGMVAGVPLARGPLSSGPSQMRFSYSPLNTSRPRARSTSFRSRTVIGGLSWGLSNLLSKPKLGFAVQ